MTDNKMTKRTNSDLQNITQKTKHQATRTPWVYSCAPEEQAVPAPLVTPVGRINLITNPVISHE